MSSNVVCEEKRPTVSVSTCTQEKEICVSSMI